MAAFTLYPISEQAVTLQFGDAINLNTHQTIMQYKAAVERANLPGFLECVPAYTSVTLYFDLLTVQRSGLAGATVLEKISKWVQSIKIESTDKNSEQKVIEIPVCYEENFGLDLKKLSKTLNLSIQEIITLHTSKVYTVFMIGFTPGFPYMGELDATLQCKRKENPRKKVPTGSVAIAGKQTGIYPFDTPGGWQIIGCTPLKLFSAESNPPTLLQAGQPVKFVPIARNEFDRMIKA